MAKAFVPKLKEIDFIHIWAIVFFGLDLGGKRVTVLTVNPRLEVDIYYKSNSIKIQTM